MKNFHRASSFRLLHRPGFSMVEVLLAVFILSIGLIMVATIFPVAADWTRQNVEEGMGANIAQNAVAIIQTKYTKADMTAGGVGQTLQALPGIAALGKLPLKERAYAFGLTPPYPAVNENQALYFWTALIKQSPSATNKYDLYILVFKKGVADQLFNNAPVAPVSALANSRDTSGETAVPYVAQVSTSPVTNLNAIPIGSQGIGMSSGTVFRQLAGNAQTPPLASNDTNVVFVPPADGTSTSPLIYIYQTTVSFLNENDTQTQNRLHPHRNDRGDHDPRIGDVGHQPSL